MANSLNPPFVSLIRMSLPTIERVPPVLARDAEIIRGDAGDHSRVTMGIELKQFLSRPSISTIMGDKDGQVPYEPHVSFVGIFLQRSPLPVELKLQEFLAVDVEFERFASFAKSFWIPPDQLFRPISPGFLLICSLE